MPDSYAEKPKYPAACDEHFPYTLFYGRLLLALLIPASILAGLLLLPGLLINWYTG
jgi:hypothetical protein